MSRKKGPPQNPSDVRYYLEGDGITQTNFEIENYDPNVDIKNENTLLVSIHAGQEGWTTALWRNSSLGQRPDGSFMVEGEMMLVTDTELRTIPAQRIGTTKPDVAIVYGCPPSIIRVNEKGEVQAILAQDPDLLNPDNIWVQNSEVPLFSPETDSLVLVDKVNELINQGFDISWVENNKGDFDLYLPTEKEDDTGDEKVYLATADIEKSSFSITSYLTVWVHR